MRADRLETLVTQMDDDQCGVIILLGTKDPKVAATREAAIVELLLVSQRLLEAAGRCPGRKGQTIMSDVPTALLERIRAALMALEGS